jgi:eukaryotic-like serine/threonine-protein kinase
MLKRNFRRGALSLAALGWSVNASCVNYHPGPVALAATDTAAAPHEVWQLHAGRAVAEPVAVDDRTLYAAGVDRIVRAISLDSGRVRWSFRLTGIVLGGTVRADSAVYVASVRPEGHVVALRASDGRKLWSTTVGETAGPFALVGGRLLVPTRKGDLLALATRDGVIQWRRRIGYARSAPIDGAGALVVASLDSIFRIDVSDGRVLQRRRSPGTMLVDWRTAGTMLIGGTADSLLVALDAGDLTIRWQTRLDAPVFSAPTVRGDTAFVATRIGTVYRVALATGEATRVVALHWPLTAGPVEAGGHLLVGGADGTIRALDAASGREIWRIAVWRPVDVAPLVVTDGFIAIGSNGDFHRYTP